MKKIYLKNYKGFEEQVIELKDVNFFVGENSTGKTSILKLINIFSSQEFWLSGQFNNDEVELGYYDEIINKNTTDSFFRVGIETTNRSSQTRKILIEFGDYRSVPKINQIKYCTSEFDCLIIFNSKKITYKNKIPKDYDLKNWANDFQFPKKEKRIELPSFELPLILLFSYIENQLGAEKKNSTPYSTIPSLYDRYYWLAPIRAKAKRIYESYQLRFSPEGEHIPSLLKRLFANSDDVKRERVLKILNDFGKDSNLYDELSIKNFGSESTSPFEIVVKYDNTEIKLPNVGYGVSQSLPLIVEILSTKGSAFSIQQPEVHLHPRAQAAFGNFLYNASLKDKNTFLIETHSDFTINRFRHCLYKKGNENISSQVLFFTRDRHTNNITHININENGSYGDNLPDAYREFFIDEELKLLEL